MGSVGASRGLRLEAMRCAVLLLVAVNLCGQAAFRLRPLADSPVVALVREERPGVVRLEGRDRAGLPWRVWLPASPALFSVSYQVGDFDRDGQQDLLVERPLPGLGACVGRAEILVLRLDQQGRPVPLAFESATIPVAIRRGRDGTAEFLASKGCADRGRWISVSGPLLAKATSGRLEELRSAEFGCRSLCAGAGMQVAGRWVEDWPSRVVLDGDDGRDVYLHDAWLGLRRAFAEGRSVRLDGDELWADGRKNPGGVEVELHVSALRRSTDVASESTEHKLDGERNAIHTAHSAMGVTHRHTTEYEAPEPGARLVSLESSHGLTQWRSASGLLFALHDDGRLREPRVAVAVPGQLVPDEDGPVFRQQDQAFAVRGYLRWRLAR